MKTLSQTLKKIYQWAQISRLYYGYLSIVAAGSLIVFLSHSTANVLVTEMIISFLPLATTLQTIALVIAFIWTMLFFRTTNPTRIWAGLLLMSTTIGWGFNLTNIWDYAYPQNIYSATWDKDINPKDTNINVKVGFFNKAYYNHETSKVSDQARLLSLDVLGIAEITEADYNTLKTQLPFTNSYFTTCQCQSSAGSQIALFSRYPLSNIQANSIEKTPMIQADITIQNKVLNVMVIHPYAPTSTADLQQRNSSLNQLSQHLKTYDNRQVLVMGDFNTASWSWSYKNFLQNQGSPVKNIAPSQPWLRDTNRGQGLTSTWNTGIFHTIIDHMVISPNISLVKSSIVEDKLGSDHHMIWSEIQL